MEKEINIVAPEGYEIDKENSTLECIKFKPIEKRWRDGREQSTTGFYISEISNIVPISGKYTKDNYNIFATERQAKSALAMARISQIIANDERFGGAITDEEWKRNGIAKYVIIRRNGYISKDYNFTFYNFLAFHTSSQRDLFLEENRDLVKDYLMID